MNLTLNLSLEGGSSLSLLHPLTLALLISASVRAPRTDA